MVKVVKVPNGQHEAGACGSLDRHGRTCGAGMALAAVNKTAARADHALPEVDIVHKPCVLSCLLASVDSNGALSFVLQPYAKPP